MIPFRNVAGHLYRFFYKIKCYGFKLTILTNLTLDTHDMSFLSSVAIASLSILYFGIESSETKGKVFIDDLMS